MADKSLRERHRAWRVARLKLAQAQAAMEQPVPLGRGATPPEVQLRQRELLLQEAERRERRARQQLMEIGPDGEQLVRETLLPILQQQAAEIGESLQDTGEKLEDLLGHPPRMGQEPPEDAEHEVVEFYRAWRRLTDDLAALETEITSLEALQPGTEA